MLASINSRRGRKDGDVEDAYMPLLLEPPGELQGQGTDLIFGVRLGNMTVFSNRIIKFCENERWRILGKFNWGGG